MNKARMLFALAAALFAAACSAGSATPTFPDAPPAMSQGALGSGNAVERPSEP